MIDRRKILGVLVLVGLLALISAFWWFFEGQYTTKMVTKRVTAETAEKVQSLLVTQIVDYGGEAATVTGRLTAREGESTLDLLENSHRTTVKKYSFGTLVESIDGVAGGKDQKYWIYYVNGRAAQEGADQYKLKSGDVVEWRFEVSKE